MNNSGLRDSFYKVSHLYDGDSEVSPTSRIAAMRLSRNGQEVAPRASSKSANVVPQPDWEEVTPDADLSWSRRSEPGKKKTHRKVTTTITTLEPADDVTHTKQTFTSTQAPGGPSGPGVSTTVNRVHQTVTQTSVDGSPDQDGGRASYPGQQEGLRWQNPLGNQINAQTVERRQYGPGGDSPGGSLDKARRKPLYERSSLGIRQGDYDSALDYKANLGIASNGIVDTYTSRRQEIYGQGPNGMGANNTGTHHHSEVKRTIIGQTSDQSDVIFQNLDEINNNQRVETGGANIFMGQGDSFSREEQNVIDSAMFTSKVNQHQTQISRPRRDQTYRRRETDCVSKWLMNSVRRSGTN